VLPDDVRGRIGDMVEAIAKIRAYDFGISDAIVWATVLSAVKPEAAAGRDPG
jgi:hypothetical protein